LSTVIDGKGVIYANGSERNEGRLMAHHIDNSYALATLSLYTLEWRENGVEIKKR